MRSLEELTKIDASAIHQLQQWAQNADNECRILPPSEENDRVLLATQVPTSLTLGALAYDTGGILVDHGWLRLIGSGNPTLPRNLADWNSEVELDYFLFADDIVGGFFGVPSADLQARPDRQVHNVHYWAPDNLQWESLGLELSDFLQWVFSPYLADFYQNLRWKTWRQDTVALRADQCFAFDPKLWTQGASLSKSERRMAPVSDALKLKLDDAGRADRKKE